MHEGVCACVYYVYMYLKECVHVCLYDSVYVYLCMHTFVVCACMQYMYVCIYRCMHVTVYICIYVYSCVCMCACIHAHNVCKCEGQSAFLHHIAILFLII